ncbi:hypothetical protein ACIRON_04690 [Nocardioides sp. NPDC101246]|uniref:hypothetical protein n=1 Tax=Nocardioides sp. NPDC101246 TaxID=3364336 RepID=UPI0037FC341E
MNTTFTRVLVGMALAVTALSLPGALSPASAAADVDVRPLPLPIGERPTVPYVHRPTYESVAVVDPATGTDVPVDFVGDDGDSFELLGQSGKGFILRVRNRNVDEIVRAQLGVPQKTLVSMYYGDRARLSVDGRYLLISKTLTTGAIQAQVRNTSTGAVVARHTFKASTRPDPIDVSGTRVLVGGYGTPRTMVWDWKAGTVTTIASRVAYAGSLATNRLATYTKDPARAGACTVVTTITRPGTQLWRGCEEKLASFSPDGARFATELRTNSDVVRRRSLRGTLLTTYRNPNGLRMFAWETNTRILMWSAIGSSGETWLVRCEAAACERTVRGNVG